MTPTSQPYRGPVVILTNEEARYLLPHVPPAPELEAVKAKLRAAVHADPTWQKPIR